MAIPKNYRAIHTGVKIKFVVPDFLIPRLDLLDNQSIGTVVREALRSAARPAVGALKSLLKSELIKSDQSTGATERAVAMKVGRSKKNPNTFFVIVGINTSHYEYHTATIPEGQITKLRRGRKQRGLGLYGLQTRMNKNRKLRSKQVFSRYSNAGRVKSLGGRVMKRMPRKYFHLINRGFFHYRGGRVAGYGFIERLVDSLKSTMQQVFVRRLQELILPIIKREIIRKWKRVLK